MFALLWNAGPHTHEAAPPAAGSWAADHTQQLSLLTKVTRLLDVGTRSLLVTVREYQAHQDALRAIVERTPGLISG